MCSISALAPGFLLSFPSSSIWAEAVGFLFEAAHVMETTSRCYCEWFNTK